MIKCSYGLACVSLFCALSGGSALALDGDELAPPYESEAQEEHRNDLMEAIRNNDVAALRRLCEYDDLVRYVEADTDHGLLSVVMEDVLVDDATILVLLRFFPFRISNDLVRIATFYLHYTLAEGLETYLTCLTREPHLTFGDFYENYIMPDPEAVVQINGGLSTDDAVMRKAAVDALMGDWGHYHLDLSGASF